MKCIQNVIVVEDQLSTRNWLVSSVKSALEPKAVFEASTCQRAKQIFLTQNIDLAIVDINLPDGSGLDLIADIKALYQTYCIVATIYNDEKHVYKAIQAGVEGYLLKDHTNEEICGYLKGLLKDKPPISPEVSRAMFRFIKNIPIKDEEHEVLSDREIEILTLLAKAYQRKEIANILSISHNTVSHHIKNIYIKIGITSKAEAVVEASRRGLIHI